jgi:hypothetical protein
VRSPRAVFALTCAALVTLAVAYVGYAVLTRPSSAGAAPTAARAGTELQSLLSQPHLVFLQPSGGDPTRNEVAVAPLPATGVARPPTARGRVLTGLFCQRAYFAGGHGICLGKDLLGSGFFFDAGFQAGRTFQQPGLPSRARIAPDGRHSASTVFVTGHGYNTPGFSTQTLIADLSSGATVNLEQFTVTRDGQRFQSPDFNFWGVTFGADGNRFYATLGTSGHTYLVEGNLATRTARVLTDGVECPDLSPDGTRVAYKRRAPGDQRQWRLHVLDLRTMVDTALAETRSVDDQVEWLDGSRILYGLQDLGPPPTLDVNLWSAPADGSGTPSLFMAHAASPAVVR